MKQYRIVDRKEVEEFCYCVNLETVHTLDKYHESRSGDNPIYTCNNCGTAKVIRSDSELENLSEVEELDAT